MTVDAPPRVSVVIPVYLDWARLRACKAALDQQSIHATEFEIIVVDNGDMPSPELCPPGIRYLHEPNGYSYCARNAGVNAARGRIVAFTDADCIPDPDWLKAGLSILESRPDLAIAGGAVEMFCEHDSAASRYDFVFGLPQADHFRRWGAFVTANMFVRRETLEALSAFNAELPSGGDFDFCWRAKAAGFRLEYCPLAKVRHPARPTLRQLATKSLRVASGVVEIAYRRRHLSLARAWKSVVLSFIPRPRDWYHTLVGGRGTEKLRPRHRPAVLLLRVVLHYVHAVGLLVALLRSVRQRGWP